MNVRLFKKDGFNFVSSDDFILNLDLMSGNVALSGDIGNVSNENDDFLYVPFRAISKTIIPGHWIDLTEGSVLKKSVKMLKGKTVFPDHDTHITKWLGLVDSAEWDESSEPNGINVTLKIDKSNDRIVKGIKMDAINNVSVQMEIKWKKSHPEMDNFDFFINEGREIGGRVVSRVVTEIIDYSEISLVYKGADPYAKKLSSRGVAETRRFEDERKESDRLKLSKKKIGNLFELKGDEEELSQERFEQFLDDVLVKVEKLEKEAEIGRTHLAELRQNVEKNYRLCVEEPNDKILELIKSDSLGYAGLQAMNNDYEKRLEEKFVSTSSTNRQSSVVDLKEFKDSKDIKIEDYVC